MTVEQIQKTTIEKVDLIMLPIVKYFEDNKNSSYEDLLNKWNDFKQKLHKDKFEIVCEILTENGIEDPFKKNSDNVIKSLVINFSSLTFDKTVNTLYTDKIKPIIIKNL